MTAIPGDHNIGQNRPPFTDKSFDDAEEWTDELNREEFCSQVSSLLYGRRSPEGIAISIEGEWGAGKSSALAMIKCHLAARKQLARSMSLARLSHFRRWIRRHRSNRRLLPEDLSPILVEFNPWLAGAADHMIQVFMAQIASEIEHFGQNSKATEAAQRLVAYAQLLEPLKWIPGAEPWTTIVKGVIEGTALGVKKVSDLHKLNISKQRDNLNKALLELGCNIIVFIDDIDRLPPAEVFQIVRAIQAVSDLSFCSFVIALDASYAEKALQRAAGFDNPGQYLDKIIQLRLALPQINQIDLEHYFIARLSPFLSLHEDRFRDEQRRFSDVWQSGVKSLVETPRDAIRIINRLLFILPQCGLEVCWGDLLGMQAIAIKIPNVYRHILRNPGAYTGVDAGENFRNNSHQEHIDQFACDRASVLESLADNQKRKAQKLLETLFPLLGTSSLDKLKQQEYSRDRRVAASHTLRIALAYDLPSDAISQTDVQSFCREPASRKDVISRCQAKGLIDHFLDFTLQNFDPSTILDDKDFVVFLGMIVESRQINNRFQGFRSLFCMTIFDKILRLSEAVLAKSSDDGDELSALGDFVSDPCILSLTTHLLAGRLRKREERLQQSENESTIALIPISDHVVLEKWLSTAINTLRDKSFLGVADKPIIVKVILSLEGGPSLISELLPPYISDDQSFDAIADIFVSNETESSDGISVFCRDEYLSILGKVDTIRLRAAQRMNDPWVNANKRLCAVYRSIVNQQRYLIESGEPEYWEGY